jgi:hypothetical protein
MLDDEKERKKCLEVVDEARERVDNNVSYKKEYLSKFIINYFFVSYKNRY